MLVHIGKRRPESLQDHLPVLLSNNLVTNAASRVDVLFPDRSDLGNNLARLGLQNALEYADGVVDQVRYCLLDPALGSHIDCLDDELFRVFALSPVFDFSDHVSNLLLR